MEEENKKSTGTKIEELHNLLVESKNKNSKKLKIPRKAKVKRRRLKQGWVGVIRIDENGNISGTKKKINGSCFNLNRDQNYHATDGREICFWEGKFPVLLQQTWKINPLDVRKTGENKNETYGQPYIKARMLGDVIKVKSKNASGIIWVIGAVVLGYLAYTMFTGGFS